MLGHATSRRQLTDEAIVRVKHHGEPERRVHIDHASGRFDGTAAGHVQREGDVLAHRRRDDVFDETARETEVRDAHTAVPRRAPPARFERAGTRG